MGQDRKEYKVCCMAGEECWDFPSPGSQFIRLEKDFHH